MSPARLRGLAALAIVAGLPFHVPAADEPARTRIVLVGDSTVTDDAGWGTAFAMRLTDRAVGVNKARSGASTKSYLDAGLWTKALAERPDVVLIQFGHNDQKGKGPDRETGPESTYRANLRRFIAEAKAAGAKPVLVTPMVRRNFQGDKVVVDPLAEYAEAVRAVAAETAVPVVDLYARSLAAVAALGTAKADALGPTSKEGRPDRTHLNPEGARVMSALVVDELRRQAPFLAPLLKASDEAK